MTSHYINKEAHKEAEKLLKFLNNSPVKFHAVKNVAKRLDEFGFKELKEEQTWDLANNSQRGFYVKRKDSALIAFVLPEKTDVGSFNDLSFRIAAAHTDSPGFKIKPTPEIKGPGACIRLNTEVYGGPIRHTWLDRPLGIAGKVSIKGKDAFKPEAKLVDLGSSVAIIPSLAIHMDRSANDGFTLNPQTQMLPVVSYNQKENNTENKGPDKKETTGFLNKKIAKILNIDIDEILDWELYLYESSPGCFVGFEQEIISSARIDDLQGIWATLNGLCNYYKACTESGFPENNQTIRMVVAFDSEEIGSSTMTGADSPMLITVMERISLSLGVKRENFLKNKNSCFMLSLDGAHAVHPNFTDKCDPVIKPEINAGPALKYSANMSYTTDSMGSAVFQSLCIKADIPWQRFVNRSDMRGGSTIGPISWTHLDIPSIDVGIPMFAMHSSRESAGVYDHYNALKFVEQYFIEN